MRLRWAVVPVVAALGVLAPAAHASTLTVDPSGASLRLVAAAGEVNDVAIGLVSSASYTWRISDAAGVSVADPRCTARNSTEVDCVLGRWPETVTAELGDRDDRFHDRYVPAVVDGGPGDDLIDGSFGRDRLDGGLGDDLLDGHESADVSDGGEGDDTVITRSDHDYYSDDGDDVLRGGPGNDVLDSSESYWYGDPKVGTIFNAVGNTLDGGPGDDELITAVGDDDVIGGDGHDVAHYDRGRSAYLAISGLYESGSNGSGDADETDRINLDIEELRGGPSREVMVGSAGDDVLIGNGGRDSLSGAGGDDLLVGGADADVLDGQEGFDTTSYAGRRLPVSVRVDGVSNDGEADEHDRVTPETEQIVGGDGPDELTGGPGDEVLVGGGGDDVLDGRDGADVLAGGPGVDTARYASRTAPVAVSIGGAAHDGAAGEDDDVRGDVERVVGGAGADRLTGDRQDNGLFGGPGRDTLDGRGGADVLDGGTGIDRALYVSSPAPVVVTLDDVPGDGAAGEGDDVRSTVENVVGSRFGDTLTGNAFPNGLAGRGGDDLLTGGAGLDLLYGGADADELHGGANGDGLWGGDGTDRLFGEGGGDQLYGEAGADAVSGGEGDDLLRERDGFLDDLMCGAGTDLFRADPGDTIAADCEGPEAFGKGPFGKGSDPEPNAGPSGRGLTPTLTRALREGV